MKKAASLIIVFVTMTLAATGMQVESSMSGYPLTNGTYAANGYLDFYENNSSTTRKAIYLDAGLRIKASQPIRLNSSGQPVVGGALATLYGNGTYTLKLRNSSGSTVWIRNGLNYASAQVVDFGGVYLDVKSTYGQTNAALGDALTAAGATENTLIFQRGAYTVTSPKTFQSNLTLKFMQGAYLDISAGVEVSILGNIDAGEYQIFKGLGKDSVAIATSANSIILKDWYGLQGASQIVTSLSVGYIEGQIISANNITGRMYADQASITLASIVRAEIVTAELMVLSTNMLRTEFLRTNLHGTNRVRRMIASTTINMFECVGVSTADYSKAIVFLAGNSSANLIGVALGLATPNNYVNIALDYVDLLTTNYLKDDILFVSNIGTLTTDIIYDGYPGADGYSKVDAFVPIGYVVATANGSTRVVLNATTAVGGYSPIGSTYSGIFTATENRYVDKVIHSLIVSGTSGDMAGTNERLAISVADINGSSAYDSGTVEQNGSRTFFKKVKGRVTAGSRPTQVRVSLILGANGGVGTSIWDKLTIFTVDIGRTLDVMYGNN